ncbi:Hypothetical predicted protein [Mytilus galloprovincialis]|uniref:Uncharacterized protein n=1 Tax=Mytilus galloprovincialis TaxID=29158 RepID=A0A8B6BIT4_MYTGA|nr:Hypothetical predicted protein [Mytilus galloprovincialis]
MADLNTSTFDNNDPNDENNSQNELFLLMPLVLPNFNLETSLLEGLRGPNDRYGGKPTSQHNSRRFEFKSHGSELVDPLIDPESDVDLIEAVNILESQKENNIVLQSRFAELDDEEMELILDDANSKETKKMTKYGVKIFKRTLSDGQNI